MLLGTSPGRYWVLYAALIAESGGGVLYVPAARARTPAIVGTGTLLSSLVTLSAAVLTWLIVPRMARIPRAFQGSREPPPHPLALSIG